MTFCTAINCMDGRVQLPVINYLKKRFAADHVDTITEPGPNLILAEKASAALVQSILSRVRISVEHHHSVGIAIAGHYDCAGNPSGKEAQWVQLKNSIDFLREYFDIPVIGLWVDENWNVIEPVSCQS